MLHDACLRLSCVSHAACHVRSFALAQAEGRLPWSACMLHLHVVRCMLHFVLLQVACCTKPCCTLNVARCPFRIAWCKSQRIAWCKSQAEAPVIGFIRTALLPLVKDKLEVRSEAEASAADR